MAKFFSIQTAAGLTVDMEKRTLFGVAIATKGKANGDTFDEETLAALATLGNAGKIRARFDHPNRADPGEIENSLDNLLGEHTNFRIDGDTLRADTVFAGVNVEKEDKVLALATKTPHLFGLSVVFDQKRPAKGTKPQKNAPARPTAFFSADFVDIPAANAAGLYATTVAGDKMDPVDVYAKDGTCYAMVEGKEYALNHTKEALDLLKGDDDDGNEGEKESKKKGATLQGGDIDVAAVQKKAADDAIASERTYRKMFATVVKSANMNQKDAEEFEETFYGNDEKVLKFMASKIIAGRAKPLGDGSGTPEGTPQSGEKTELQKAEEAAGKRFDEEDQVRSMYGHNLRDKESAEYKSARGRHLAAVRRSFARKD